VKKEALLKEGRKAPAFRLPEASVGMVRLSDFVGQTVVLYFFPKAGTPGCTAQACGIRDRLAEYADAGAVVIGISRDMPEELHAFAHKYDLPFYLLSDPDHKVAEKYGVWVEKSMYGRRYWGVQRATFVIAPDGKVAKTFPKVSPRKHDDLVLEALREVAAAP
jgi:thioredoxin-dependent peroxiredoxin